MKKTVYFRLEYYKDTDDLSYKYRNKLFDKNKEAKICIWKYKND